LATRGDELHAAGAEPEDQNDHKDRNQPDQENAVELERRSFKKDCGREEVVDRRTLEPTTSTVTRAVTFDEWELREESGDEQFLTPEIGRSGG
jgi:hypothetical protein